MARHRSAFGVGPEARFCERRFVIAESYTGGSDNLKKSFAEAAQHRDGAYNARCRGDLDYARGDDFLQIGRCDLRTALKFIFRFGRRLLADGPRTDGTAP